jgi:hypothetical protein
MSGAREAIATGSPLNKVRSREEALSLLERSSPKGVRAERSHCRPAAEAK